ncbi:hypothetical protein K438DRAFT_1773747 [Mycena galopus ATCC 62051]|nr:hypothetical protein K438DRAFT_1773747 [Mycena galopus ATCC 62051]
MAKGSAESGRIKSSEVGNAVSAIRYPEWQRQHVTVQRGFGRAAGSGSLLRHSIIAINAAFPSGHQPPQRLTTSNLSTAAAVLIHHLSSSATTHVPPRRLIDVQAPLLVDVLYVALSAPPAFARDALGGDAFLATKVFLYADAAAEGAGQCEENMERKCLIDEPRDVSSPHRYRQNRALLDPAHVCASCNRFSARCIGSESHPPKMERQGRDRDATTGIDDTALRSARRLPVRVRLPGPVEETDSDPKCKARGDRKDPTNTGISARAHTAGNSTPRPARVAARSAVRAPVATPVRAPESALARAPAATTTVTRRLPTERIRAAVQLDTRAKAPTSTTSVVVRAPVAAPVRAPTPAVARTPVTTRATTTTGPPASTTQVGGHTVTAIARALTSAARVPVSTVVRSSATATRLASASVPGIAGGASRQIASKQALRPPAPSSALDAARSTGDAAPVYDYRLWDDDEEEEEEEEEEEIWFGVRSLREVLDRIRRDSPHYIPSWSRRSSKRRLSLRVIGAQFRGKDTVKLQWCQSDALSDPEKWNSNWEALLRRDFTFPNGPHFFHQKVMQIETTPLLLDGALAGYPDLVSGTCIQHIITNGALRYFVHHDVCSTAGNLNEARS